MADLTILPFDLKGVLDTNLIKGEIHTLTKVTGKTNRMFCPKQGAYFKDSLEVRTEAGVPLVINKDYVTTYYYPDLWELNAKAVCAIIVVTNPDVANTVRISYRAIGGPYSLSVEEIKAILDGLENVDTKVKWDEIIDKPLQFNPAPHTHEYWQLYGLESTVINLELLGKAWGVGTDGIIGDNRIYYKNFITQGSAKVDDYVAKIMAHIDDKNNPHATNKAKIGLSEINNWGMATVAESSSQTLTGRYQPMGGIFDQLTVNVIPAFNSHVANMNNPHKVSLSDPLLNLYSTQQIQSLYSQCLSRTNIADNSQALGGVTLDQLLPNVRTGLTVNNVAQGSTFQQSQLAPVPGNVNDYALVGDQSYRSYASLMASANDSVQQIYFIGSNPLTSYNDLPVGATVITGAMEYIYIRAKYMNIHVYVKTGSTTWQQTF